MENNVLVREVPTEEAAMTVMTREFPSPTDSQSNNHYTQAHGLQKVVYDCDVKKEQEEVDLESSSTECITDESSNTAVYNSTNDDVVITQIQQLIEDHQLSRDDILAIYDNYAALKVGNLANIQKAEVVENLQSNQTISLLSSELQTERPEDFIEIDTDIESNYTDNDDDVNMMGKEAKSPIQSVFLNVPPQVNKMQTLVSDAMETMSRTSGLTSEIGQKRKYLTLEDELQIQLSLFVEQLLERDQTVVAQVIKHYMNQYSIPQREVVEITGLNQSHLSQHFLHGVTMKRAKRVRLYQWFEEDQKNRTGKLQSADGNLCAVLDGPKVEGNRRRPRWKWSPISTQILTEAFKKNQFPTRDQRLELSRICNEAEVAMNNGALARGPEGDTEGITEQRVNTWFTNRRKGLGTPITPPPLKTAGAIPSSSSPLFGQMIHPPLLRAAPATTTLLTNSKSVPSSFKTHHSSHGSPHMPGLTNISSVEENKTRSFSNTPTTMQTLVTQIQETQVNQAQLSRNSPIHHQLMARPPPLGVPLAIALPGNVTHTNLLPPPTGNTTYTSAPNSNSIQPVAVPFSISPALVSPSQVQALISQFHSPFTTHGPIHVNLPLTTVPGSSRGSPSQSRDAIHILKPSRDMGNGQPESPLASVPQSSLQTVTVASNQSQLLQHIISGTAQSACEPQNEQSLQQTQMHLPSGNFILSPGQLQALVSQIQAQQRIGDGHNQILIGSQAPQFQLVTVPGFSAMTTGNESD